MGQPSLITVAADANVLRPSNSGQWQFYRDTSVAGLGVYKAMNENGFIEIIGGPGFPIGGNDWHIVGNADIVDGVNFLGTTNDVPLTFKVNNVQAGRIDRANSNAFFGYQAGLLNIAGTAGQFNTYVGSNSGAANSVFSGNTAIGYNTLLNSIAHQNTAVGFSSLQSNTTGTQNVGVGPQSLFSNTIGDNNIAIGQLALFSNVAGDNSVAIGSESQRYSNDVAIAFDNTNTSVGYQSLRGSIVAANNTGIGNTVMGYQAMLNNTTGLENSAYGYLALNANTTGIYNDAFGSNALVVNTTGLQNAAFGNYSLSLSVTGDNNTAIGNSALFSSDGGSDNTAVGSGALSSSVAVDPAPDVVGNTAVGRSALGNSTTGINNTAIGWNAGVTNTTGSRNVFVGFASGDATFATTNDNLFIHNSTTPSPLIYGKFTTGNIGFNNSTFDATATNTLSMVNGTTEAGGAIANGIQIFSRDTDDGAASLGLFLEQAVVAEVLASTHTLKVRINGAQFKIQLTNL